MRAINATMSEEISEVQEYPADVLRRAKMLDVHPDQLLPHDGSADCAICGCSPGEEHSLLSHYAEAARQHG